MEILYISALSSKSVIDAIYRQTHSNPGFAVQKFSRLIMSGFVANHVKCRTLSTPPIQRKFAGRVWCNLPDEIEDHITYNYIPYIDIPILKHICVLIYTFLHVLAWGVKDRYNRVVICDVLSVSACMGALFASKCSGIKSVAVVTDIYDQIVGKRTRGIRGLLSNMAGILNRWYVGLFSSYVLLTDAMNELVNPKQKPYIVMEALCDAQMMEDNNFEKSWPKIVMYAGGLEVKYGLKMLVDGFKEVDVPDIELHIYGSGSFESELQEEVKKDERIKYLGVRPNAEIVEAERKATLLVNPRFTTEEFTKFSFPSKNIEYMASGTPLLTTKLPGMPIDYYQYVYLFEDETIEGYAKTLSKVLMSTSEELYKKGYSAQKYVLNRKNNIVQSKRILELLCKI